MQVEFIRNKLITDDMKTALILKKKRILSALGAVAAFAMAFMVAGPLAHADSTFDSTGALTSTTEPMLSDIAATSSSDGTGATISWNTDEDSTSQAAFGAESTEASSSMYSAYTGIDQTMGTNHSVALDGLTPGTVYHFQAISRDGSGFSTYSDDHTFTTLGGTDTSTSTETTGTSTTDTGTTGTSTNATSTNATSTNPVAPVISAITVSPSNNNTAATIYWTTDVASDSYVKYGDSADVYTSSTNLDSTPTTDHSELITDLVPGNTYHFIVMSTASSTSATSTDQVFTMPSDTNTGTGTGTGTTSTSTSDVGALSGLVAELQARVATLEGVLNSLQAQVANLINGNSSGGTGSNNGGTSTGTSTSTSMATISPESGTSVRAGTSIDLGGRNFWPDEQVKVMNNGDLITTARADGGGNFTTGSLPVSRTTGTQTYTLVGVESGISRSTNITVTP